MQINKSNISFLYYPALKYASKLNKWIEIQSSETLDGAGW